MCAELGGKVQTLSEWEAQVGVQGSKIWEAHLAALVVR